MVHEDDSVGRRSIVAGSMVGQASWKSAVVSMNLISCILAMTFVSCDLRYVRTTSKTSTRPKHSYLVGRFMMGDGLAAYCVIVGQCTVRVTMTYGACVL